MIMITEMEVETVLDVPKSEYPPELIEMWIKRSDIMARKLETGEIKPKSLREMAAERGIQL
jgi:hypothetical protein